MSPHKRIIVPWAATHCANMEQCAQELGIPKEDALFERVESPFIV